MPRKSPFVLVLTDVERRKLQHRASQYTLPYRDVVRAKIVLMATDGLDNDQIAARIGTHRLVVSKWRKRFFEEGIDGLEERPRQGRPQVFSPRAGG